MPESDSPSYARLDLPALVPGVRVDDPRAFLAFARDALDARIEDETLDDEGRLRYALVRLPGGAAVEASQSREEWPTMLAGLHYYVADVDAVHAKCIEAGGTELHPPSAMPYGERGSAVEDPVGNHWYLATAD